MRESELGLLIVVGGPGKSGSSTISKMLAEHFKLTRYYGGQIMRDYAKDHSMDLVEFFQYLEKNNLGEKYDRLVDDYLFERAKEKDVLIESKTFAALAKTRGFPVTVSIWLETDIKVRAKRALMVNGSDVSIDSEEFRYELERLSTRYELDMRRFENSYDMDYSSPKLYNDIVLDTSNINEKETFDLIVRLIKDGGYIKS